MKKHDKNATWYCTLCRTYGTYQEMLDFHVRVGHAIKEKHVPKVYYCSDGNILLNWKNKAVWVMPTVGLWRDIQQSAKNSSGVIKGDRSGAYTRAQNLLAPYIKEGKTWEWLGYRQVGGNLENVLYWFNNAPIGNSCAITKEELVKLFFEALDTGRYIRNKFNRDSYQIFFTLSTNLQGKPKDSSSRWVLTTKNEIEIAHTDQSFDLREQSDATLRETTKDAIAVRAIGDGLD